MVNTALAKARIDSQGLTGPMSHAGSPLTPRDVVDIFGAMQGQDLPGAVASIALRTGGGAPEVIDAFNRGEIVRGYPMRGTVFVQTAEDARWTSELCNASEVRAARKRSPQLGLEDHHFLTARKVLEKTALDGVSRRALFQSWNEQGVSPEHGRGYHVLKHLLATGVASYGTWNGKDNNVHLAEHWLPRGSSLAEKFNGDTIAATAELMRRYFSSRGPATIRDMAWWSKLPLRMLNAALPQLHDLERGQVFGLAETAYWNPEATHILTQPSKHASDARLLPRSMKSFWGIRIGCTLFPNSIMNRWYPETTVSFVPRLLPAEKLLVFGSAAVAADDANSSSNPLRPSAPREGKSSNTRLRTSHSCDKSAVVLRPCNL